MEGYKELCWGEKNLSTKNGEAAVAVWRHEKKNISCSDNGGFHKVQSIQGRKL